VDPDTLAIARDLRGGFDLDEDISIRIYADESIGLLQAAINCWSGGVPGTRWKGKTYRILF